MDIKNKQNANTRKAGRLSSPGVKERRILNEGPFRFGRIPDNILAEKRPDSGGNRFTPHWINMITPKHVALEGWIG